MPSHHTLLAVSLIPALYACTPSQEKTSGAAPVQELAPVTAITLADPMAPFARMMPGEWKTTVHADTSMFDTWYWGPGQHSMRVMTDGSAASGDPWRELRVLYWHPGRKKVCVLGLNPFARSLFEGTITFDGKTAEALIDMHQTGARRALKSRWTFDGPDRYHDELLEATGPADYAPLAAWDRVRVAPSTTPRTRAAAALPKPSEYLKALEPLLGRMWETPGQTTAKTTSATTVESSLTWTSGDALPMQTTFEYVPYADGIYARVLAPSKNGEPRHLLDVYLFHHTGTSALRCLALSEGGGVYEGDAILLDGRALQLDLKGYEGDRVVPYVVQLDFESVAMVRQRVWSTDDAGRTLVLDVRHRSQELKNDELR